MTASVDNLRRILDMQDNVFDQGIRTSRGRLAEWGANPPTVTKWVPVTRAQLQSPQDMRRLFFGDIDEPAIRVEVRPPTLSERVRMAAQRIARRLMP